MVSNVHRGNNSMHAYIHTYIPKGSPNRGENQDIADNFHFHTLITFWPTAEKKKNSHHFKGIKLSAWTVWFRTRLLHSQHSFIPQSTDTHLSVHFCYTQSFFYADSCTWGISRPPTHKWFPCATAAPDDIHVFIYISDIISARNLPY